MTPAERFLRHRLQEELRFLQVYVLPTMTEDDALTYLRDQCGFGDDGTCRYLQSEYCVLDCPFRPDTAEEHD